MIAIKTKFRLDKEVKRPAKIDTSKLQSETIRQEYELQLKNMLDAVSQMNDIVKRPDSTYLGNAKTNMNHGYRTKRSS